MNIEMRPCHTTPARRPRTVRLAATLLAGLLLAGCVPGLPEPEPRAAFPIPASFGGVLPCSDCAGVRTALRLRADAVVLMRQTFLGRPGPDSELSELGRWRLRDDGRVLLLEVGASTLNFAVLDDDRLAPLDRLGHPIADGALHELRRGDDAGAFDEPFRWRGMFRYMADAGVFHECQSGLTLPVAKEEANAQLERAYLSTRASEGADLMFTLRGRLVQRPATEGEGMQEMLLVTEVDRAWPSEHCAVAPPTAPVAGLEDTVWWLRALEGASLPVSAEDRPRMRLLPANARVEAFGGCNSVFGSYEADSGRLSIDGLATTRKYCADLEELESRLLEVLRSTDGYIIDTGELVLYSEGLALARWTSEAP